MLRVSELRELFVGIPKLVLRRITHTDPQGFGQHEPLIGLNLHGYSRFVKPYRLYVYCRAKVCEKYDPLARPIRGDTLAVTPEPSSLTNHLYVQAQAGPPARKSPRRGPD